MGGLAIKCKKGGYVFAFAQNRAEQSRTEHGQSRRLEVYKFKRKCIMLQKKMSALLAIYHISPQSALHGERCCYIAEADFGLGASDGFSDFVPFRSIHLLSTYFMYATMHAQFRDRSSQLPKDS